MKTDSSKIEMAREAKRKRMEEARLRHQKQQEENELLRQKNEKLKEGFDGVISNAIFEQEELDGAIQRSKESAEELEKIAKRLQEDDCIQPNAKQAEYVLSLICQMVEGYNFEHTILSARHKAFCGGTRYIDCIEPPKPDKTPITKLAIDKDTYISLKSSWETIKEKLQDVFTSEYDGGTTRRFTGTPKDRPMCGFIDDLLYHKYGDFEYEFLLLHNKIYDSYYGKAEQANTEENNGE